jgi:hypothetical protein
LLIVTDDQNTIGKAAISQRTTGADPSRALMKNEMAATGAAIPDVHIWSSQDV